jgi:sirohydrochlorin cobaltochelatase
MPIAEELAKLLHQGVRRIGELEFHAIVSNESLVIFHWQDRERVGQAGHGGLKVYMGPSAARELSLFTADGHYRFAKGQQNLRRGWLMVLRDEEELRQAIDQFYPAGLGLFLAWQNGTLEVEHLRAKLARQTGMYRAARAISDPEAQRLVREVCGPDQHCAKRILWQIDGSTPLEDSEASRYNGISNDVPSAEAVPLLCREACNHLVAECRRVAVAARGSKE